MINVQQLDHLTEEFYRCISFNTERYPQFDQLKELFYGDGKLMDCNYDEPIEFTVQGYVQAIMLQIEEGNASFCAQQEVSDITEIFGRTAQRISVFEYSFAANDTQPWKRGVNYIQYVLTGDGWKIVSMIWSDEREEVSIPATYLLV